MQSCHHAAGSIVLSAFLAIAGPAWSAILDPLDVPAERIGGIQQADRQPLIATTMAGSRIVAVGLRGLIIYSDNGGVSWHQAAVPVQVDLTGVQFISPQHGWAVGHDAVVLHTDDGGATWIKQLDANLIKTSFVSYYAKLVASGHKEMQPFLDEMKLNSQGSTSLPFLGVRFENGKTGYAVGSFGMIAATTDGGATWVPWLDHIENPDFLNLNAIKRVGSHLYVVGEKGAIYELDAPRQQFLLTSSGYGGSFFDVAGYGNVAVAVGLRGTLFRHDSDDQGWRKVETGVTASLTSVVTLADGEFILTTEDGQVIESSDKALTFREILVPIPMLFTGCTAVAAQKVALTGYQGFELLRMVDVAKSAQGKT